MAVVVAAVAVAEPVSAVPVADAGAVASTVAPSAATIASDGRNLLRAPVLGDGRWDCMVISPDWDTINRCARSSPKSPDLER
ncbi:hypothetical protein GCM10027161_54100 [Microbispora hainanensis]